MDITTSVRIAFLDFCASLPLAVTRQQIEIEQETTDSVCTMMYVLAGSID